MAGYNFDSVGYAQGEKLVDVNIKSMHSNALSGLMQALKEQAIAINRISDNIDDIETEGERDRRRSEADRRRAEAAARAQLKADRSSEQSAQVRSTASERRQRAANAAVFGKIDKFTSVFDMFAKSFASFAKEMLSKIGEFAKQSLRSYDDSTREMRKQFLTTKQISENLLKGDAAKKWLSDELHIEVNSSETKAITSQLTHLGADTSALSEKQIAAITMMNKTMGTDVKTALTLVKTSKDPEALIKMAVQASDTVGREATSKLMESVNEDWFALYARQAGGTEAALSQLQKAAKDLDASLGDYGLGADQQKSLITGIAKISSGQIDKVKQEEISNALAISGEAMKSPEKLMEGIQNMITRSDMTTDEKLAKLNVLGHVEGMDQNFMNSLKNAIIAQENGTYQQKSVRSEEDNKEAINQAQKGGRIGGKIDSVMTGINIATGGLFSKMSAGINEMFGDSMGMEDIVSSGFKFVCSLLTTIVASKIIGNPLGLLTKAIGSIGIFSKVKGFFKKDSGDKPAELLKKQKLPEVKRDLDREYAESIEKFKHLPSYFKTTIKESFEKLKTVPGVIKKSSSEAFERLKLSAGNLKQSAHSAFASIKHAFKNAPSTIKRTFDDIKKRGVIAMSKIPGMFKGVGGKIGAGAAKVGKGALAGIGIASGVLGLLGATGAFDSLTPILEDFSKTIAPVLADVVNTLAPTIQELLQSLGPVIQQLVKSLSPILDSVLKVVTPILTKVLQSLTPVLDSLFNTLTPILESVFSVLTPVIDTLVQTVMPIFTTIVETLMPVVSTVLDVLSPILKTILGTLGPVLNTISSVATPILEVIGSVLKGISPVLEFALKPIAFALDVLTAPLRLIASIMSKNDTANAANEAAGAAQRAHESGDTETARKAAAVQVAYSQGWDELEREEGESDESYYARAYDSLKETANESVIGGDRRARRKELQDILNNTTYENFEDKMIDALNTAVEHNNEMFGNVKSDNFFGTDIDDWKKLPDAAIVEKLGKVFGYNKPYKDKEKDTIRRVLDILVPERSDRIKLGGGGVFSSATDATIGEAGKEAVVPLERPEDMRRVLSELNHNEKLRLLKALLSKKSSITFDLLGEALQQVLGIGQSHGTNQGILDALPKDGVPGDDPATINRILNMAGPYRDVVWKRLKYGWKGNYKKGKDAFAQRKEWFEESKANAANHEGRELIAGTYAERALDFGVSELGKPYILRSLGKIGYVCNELVNACLRASGFDMKKFNFWTVNGTLQEILQGKRSNSKKYPDFRIRRDITPETAIPGMVFFQDSKKRKDGSFQPGHIGLVYYGHQRLHSAGGSQSYYPGTFLPKWQTPCRGVTINPFDSGARYLFGEFPGLFEKATGEWSAPTGANLGSYAPFGPGYSGETGEEIRAAAKAEKASGSIGKEIKARAKEAGLLTDDDINKIIEEAGYNYMPAEFGEYIKAAQEISKNTASKEEIIAILLDIARYLRGAISKPAGGFMSQMTNAVRQGVESNIYGSGSGRSR